MPGTLSTFLNPPTGSVEFMRVEGPLKLGDKYLAQGNMARTWQGCISSSELFVPTTRHEGGVWVMGPSANETQVWVQKNAIGYF